MKEREKEIVLLAAVLILIGLILIAISQTYTTIYVETNTENGITYHVSSSPYLSNGTSITRPYSIGEKISLEFIPNTKATALPDILQADFLIISPSGKQTVFTYWLETHGSDRQGYLILDIDEVETFEFDGLVPYNSSTTKFVGETIENGNYTLVYILDTPWIHIGSLDLTKIAPEKEYPSAYILPFGIALAIAGTILTLLPLRRHRTSPRRKKVDEVKV
jgi:hypothetical protein